MNRKLKKLLTKPDLFFYDLFRKRLNSQVTPQAAGIVHVPVFFAALEKNPWMPLVNVLQLHTGALTGRRDQSLLLNANKFAVFSAGLQQIAEQQNLGLRMYSGSGNDLSFFEPGKVRAGKRFQDAINAFSAKAEFVVEFLGENLHSVAVHIHMYDVSAEEMCVVRSAYAYQKKFPLQDLESIYPSVQFDDNGDFVLETPFPIDVVYTWVNKDDPQWLELWNETFPEQHLDADRFASHDELLYSLRALEKFAPWVNQVYVVSNCARPDTLKNFSRVKWVGHEEIFPDLRDLPTFNSHSIESCLHRIPHLSENFIYFNDDVFLAQPSYPEHFFDQIGRCVMYFEPYGMVEPKMSAGDVDYLQASFNSVRLLGQLFPDYRARQLHRHVPSAHKKSLLARLESLYSESFQATRSAKLRSPSDINTTSFLAPHYYLASGNALANDVRAIIVRPNNIRRLMTDSRDTTYRFLCFNDGNGSAGDTAYKDAFAKFCERRLSTRSAYERADMSCANVVVKSPPKRIVLVYGGFLKFDSAYVGKLAELRKSSDRLIVGLSREGGLESSYEDRRLILSTCNLVDAIIPYAEADQIDADVEEFSATTVVDLDLGIPDLEERLDGVMVYSFADTFAVKPVVSAPVEIPDARELATKVIEKASSVGNDVESGTSRNNIGLTPKVNFVYLSASENLRNLEEEFADGISSKLAGFSVGKKVRSIDAKAVNITFWINRRAHIMMSHGVADKNYLTRRRNGIRLLNKYHRVLVPGNWLKQKILRTPGIEIPSDAIDIVGWPRLDRLLARRDQMAAQAQPSGEGKKLRVLWAPTHGGRVGASSYPEFLQYEGALKEMFDYTVSTHPNERGGGRPTFELLLEADVVIADQGTLLYEAWALGKTVICPSWLVKDGIIAQMPGSAEAHIYDAGIGYHATSFDELVDMVKAKSSLPESVHTFMADYLDASTIGRSYALIADSARTVWNEGLPLVKGKESSVAAE